MHGKQLRNIEEPHFIGARCRRNKKGCVREKQHIGIGIGAPKTDALGGLLLDQGNGLAPSPDQPRKLRTRIAAHTPQKAQHHALLGAAQPSA